MRKYILFILLFLYSNACLGQDINPNEILLTLESLLSESKLEEAYSYYLSKRDYLDSASDDLLGSAINVGLYNQGKNINIELTVACIERTLKLFSEYRADYIKSMPTEMMAYFCIYMTFLVDINNPLYQEAYRLFKEIWPTINKENYSIYITVLEKVSTSLFSKSRYEETIPILEELIDINKQGYQLSHLYETYRLLGFCYQNLENFDKAATSYDYALINTQPSLIIEEDNETYINLVRDRFDVAFKLSQFSKCREFGRILINYYENKDIHKQDYINVLMELAEIELSTFNYEDGLSNYEKGLSLILKSSTYSDVEKKQFLENLYTIYNKHNIGEKERKFKSDKEKYQISSDIKVKPIVVVDYLDSLVNRVYNFENNITSNIKQYIVEVETLSDYYAVSHQEKQGIELLERTILKCQEKNINEQDYAVLYCSLGIFYSNLNYLEKAVEFHNKAKKVYRRNGMLNADYINILCWLASDYRFLGKLNLSKAHLDEAWNLSSSMSGFNSVKYSYYFLLDQYSKLYLSLDNEEKALSYNSMILDDISANEDSNNYKITYQISRIQLLLYFNNYLEAKQVLDDIGEENVDKYEWWSTSFDTKYFTDDPSCTYDLEKLAARYMKLIIRSYSSFNPVTLKDYWNIYGRLLNMYYSMALNKFHTPSLKISTYNNLLFTKSFQLELNKFYMSHKSEPVTEDIVNSIIHKIGNVDNIYSKLLNNEVAVEFFVVNNRKSFTQIEKKYGALILKKNYHEPVFVELCSCDSLDKLIYTNTIDEAELYADKLYDIRNNAIYKLIWEPLEKEIPIKSTVYVSGCGSTYFINLSAISNGNVRLDTMYDIHNVISTSNIKSNREIHQTYQSAAIFGGIDYDTSMNKMAMEATKYSQNILIDDYSMVRGENERGAWGKLKYSLEEAISISTLLSSNKLFVETHTGSDALEEAFKALSGSSPDIIHISTHGFYYQPYIHNFRTDYSNSFFTGNNNDLLNYNGLLFSGANNAWRKNQYQENVDDGILTAKEVYSLDLSKTKLLTLSACQTGLGESNDIDGNEGLLKAFKVAGVNNIIMTLWNVSDDATSTIMSLFYKNLIEIKNPREALKKTITNVKLDMPDPYYWAPFVIVE